MRLTPYSFNNFFFQQSNRVNADFVTPYDWSIGGLATNNIPRNEDFPKYSGKIFGGGVKVVNVVLNCADLDRDPMVIAMDIKGAAQHPFYAIDEFGKLWYVNVVAVGLNFQSTSGNTANFGYVLECDDPTWEKVDEQTDTWNITSTPEAHTITCEGNQPNYPVYEITPTSSAANYYIYHQYISNYNPIAAAQQDGIDITDGGWNTAALVAAGKMLASGDDCRVFCNGVEIPRWVGGGGWNSATTKIIIQRVWLPGKSLTLKTAIAATGTPAKIYFNVTAANKAILAKMPVRGMIKIGTEDFSYRSRNSNSMTVDIVERAIRDTTAAVHAINAVAWWVEHDIKIIYGNPSAETPVYSDAQKPVWNLATSTNSSRVYAEFADRANLRVGRFVRQLINNGTGDLSRLYSGNQGAADEVDPATDMGMEIANYQSQGRWKPETAELAWQYYHPAGITHVTSNGEKWRAFTTTIWPARAGLESSPNGAAPWALEWNEATPTNPASWATTWTHNAEAMPAGTKFIRFIFNGSINALANNIVRFEVDAATITLTSANVIQVGMNGEVGNYQFSIQKENSTTGESMIINYPVFLNRTLIIDTKNLEVTYRGVNAFAALTLDSVRTELLKLIPGDNAMIFTAISPSTGDLTVVTRIHSRSL